MPSAISTSTERSLQSVKVTFGIFAGEPFFLDFSERRVRALEGVVQYRPEAVRTRERRPANDVVEPDANANGISVQPPAEGGPVAPGAPQGDGQARRRRRRRRGRRGAGPGDPSARPANADGSVSDADLDADTDIDSPDDAGSEIDSTPEPDAGHGGTDEQ